MSEASYVHCSRERALTCTKGLCGNCCDRQAPCAATNHSVRTSASDSELVGDKGTALVSAEQILAVEGQGLSLQLKLEPADIERLVSEYVLPEDYDAKHCDLCGCTSLSPCPWPDDADCCTWGGLIPWASGKKEEPRGSLCRIRGFVFAKGGFTIHYEGIRKYKTAIAASPTLLQEFRDCRKKYVELKAENPHVVFGKATRATRALLWCQQIRFWQWKKPLNSAVVAVTTVIPQRLTANW